MSPIGRQIEKAGETGSIVGKYRESGATEGLATVGARRFEGGGRADRARVGGHPGKGGGSADADAKSD